MNKTNKCYSSLKSERLKLRSFEMEATDIEALYCWENDPSSWSSSTARNPISASFIKEYILESVGSIVTRQEMVLAITLRTSGELIGYLQFLGYDPISRRIGYGLYIAPLHRRQGYAKEVICMAETYAFKTLGVQLVYADILASNEASCRLFDSLGYKLTATLPKWHWADGEWHDLNYYLKWNQQSPSV